MEKNLIFACCAFFALVGCDDPEPSTDWKRVDFATNADLNVISFVDNNVGFVGASQQSRLSSASHAFIDETYFDYVKEVHINSDSTKYFYVEYSAQHPEPVLFKTTDGGGTWHEMQTPFVSDVVDISFIDERNGYVMTKNEGLYKTADAGVTWKRVLSNIAFLGDQRIVSDLFRKIHFFTPLEGIAFHEAKGTVVKTVDGGKNWSIVPYFDIKCVSCGLKNVVFPNGLKTGFASYMSKFIKTLDAGETWEEVPFTTPYDENGDAFYIDDLTFIDVERGAMVYGGSAYKTIDGGQTWESVAERHIHGDRILLRGKDQLYLQYSGNPALSHVDLSTREYNFFSSQGDPSSITDWDFAGNQVFAVGRAGMLLKFEMK